MFAGPIFVREAVTAPRRTSHFLVRAGYVLALFVLMYTAGQSTFGWQQVRNVGDFARYGQLVFQLFSVVQLSLVLFFSLLFAAGNVAQEKDRRTLLLLFMTDLRSGELVLGKLLASTLTVGVLIAASLPVFAFVRMLGGVGLDQAGWMVALCAATAFAAASWGTMVAFWRNQTFQTLSVSVLGVVAFIGVVEVLVAVLGDGSAAGQWIGYLDPFRTMFALLDPLSDASSLEAVTVSAAPSVGALVVLATVLNGVAVWRLRIWYPPRTIHVTPETVESEKDTATVVAQPRNVWTLPVLWREIRTRAYGRRVFLIKAVYLLLASAGLYQAWTASASGSFLGMFPMQGMPFLGLGLLTLILVNAQAVTAITSERDGNTLELLLVTDVTAKEFVLGKLWGVLFNAKELLLVPLLFAGVFGYRGVTSIEEAVLLGLGFVVLAGFSAMLGLHAGLSFDSSRSAIANSLGTTFFQYVGIFVFMMLLVEARGSALLQIQSFLLFIVFGSIALYASLTNRNPSNALMIAAGALPFATFYAIVSYLLGDAALAFLSVAAAYGFATAAMLIPAISDFDVALGRTTLDKG